MIDSVAIVIEKITSKKPLTEDQGKKLLEDFLKKKNYPELGLELRDLIEICLHYTILNPVVVLNNEFRNNFQKDGRLKEPEKVMIDVKKNEKDFEEVEKVQKLFLKEYSKEECKLVKIMKITTGLSINYNTKPVFKWEQLYYCQERIYGAVMFNSDKDTLKIVKDSFEQYSLKCIKSRVEENIHFEVLSPILKTIINKLNEARS